MNSVHELIGRVRSAKETGKWDIPDVLIITAEGDLVELDRRVKESERRYANQAETLVEVSKKERTQAHLLHKIGELIKVPL